MLYEVLGYRNGRNTDSAEADVHVRGLERFEAEVLIAKLGVEGFATILMEDDDE